jgi:integrase
VTYQLTPDKYLSPQELKLLKLKLQDVPEQYRAYFMVLLETGARASEALAIQPTDLLHEHKSVLIRGLKNSRDREIPLSQELFSLLSKLAIASDGFLFPWKLRNSDRLWHLYRPCRKKLHALRHTFAVNLYQKTRDIKIVQFALGHKNIANTMIYLEIDQTETLRRLMSVPA